LSKNRPNFRLCHGRYYYEVQKTQLLEKLGLFQDSPGLLASQNYEVRNQVRRRHFEAFLRMVEGDPIVVSESTRESFSLLAEEFGFAELLAACSEFVQPSSPLETPAVSNEESNSVETDQVELPRVVITVRHRVNVYESFHSRYGIEEFVRNLAEAKERGVRFEGAEGIEEAIKAVYANTAAAFPDGCSKNPFLAYVLWKLYEGLRGYSFDTRIYFLNRLHEMAPTGWDKARLLILSQCDPCRYGSYILVPNPDVHVIADAIGILKRQKNGRAAEARELLLQLKDAGGYELALGRWPSDSCLRVTEPRNAQKSGVTGAPDRPTWFQRLFVSWFRPQSVGAKDGAKSITVE
jgi:hypothetical protein